MAAPQIRVEAVDNNGEVNLTDASQQPAAALDWLAVAKADETRQEFLKCVGDIRSPISRPIWAFAMVASVEKLRYFIQDLKSPRTVSGPFFKALGDMIKTAINVWRQRATKESPISDQNIRPEGEPQKKKQKTGGEVSEQLRETRDNSVAQKCLLRDDQSCVLLGYYDPDVAHIIPFSLQCTLKGNETEQCDSRGCFWAVLDAMYTQSERQEFLRAAGVIKNPANGLEQRVDNLLCLEPLVHRRWSQGYLAFEPIPRNPDDQDRKQSLVFHWMPIVKHSTGYFAAGEHPQHEIASADDDSSDLSSLGARLYGCDGSRIFTGHRIEMTTGDSKLWPLPSYNLLRLQWDVQRLMHLQAGAEPEELSDDSDSDDSDSDDSDTLTIVDNIAGIRA